MPSSASGQLKPQHFFWRCATLQDGKITNGVLIGRSWSSVVKCYTDVDIAPPAKKMQVGNDAMLTGRASLTFVQGHHEDHGPQFASVLDPQHSILLSDKDLRQFAEEKDTAFKHRALNRRDDDPANPHNFAVDIGNHASSVGHTVYAPNFFLLDVGDGAIVLTKATLLDPFLKSKACAKGTAAFNSPQVPTMREKGTKFMSEAPKTCAIITRVRNAAVKLHTSIAPEAAAEADEAASKFSYLKNGVEPYDEYLERFNITVNFNSMRGYGSREAGDEGDDDDDSDVEDVPRQRMTRNSNGGELPSMDSLPPSNITKSMQGKEYYARSLDSNVPYRLVTELPPDSVAASKGHFDINDLYAGMLITGVLAAEPQRLAGGETFLEVDSRKGKITPSHL